MAVAVDRLPFGKRPETRATPKSPLLSERAFTRYLETVDELVTTDAGDLPRRVAEAISTLVSQRGWLPAECCEPGDECYRRHLLYTDPAGRFTVLALVWSPGHTTPVHGHTAWGAVGVYQGHPSVAAYSCCQGKDPVLKGEFHCCPGEVSHVDAGVGEPHRIFNNSNDIAITIHTYGRDLSVDPGSINILF